MACDARLCLSGTDGELLVSDQLREDLIDPKIAGLGVLIGLS